MDDGLNFGFQNYIFDWVNICEILQTACFIRSVGGILLWTWCLYHCLYLYNTQNVIQGQDP